ncbi:hypothetical protein Hdeb2414_s0018g00530661 [Helianthus debilis subsp. tardiflorus]
MYSKQHSLFQSINSKSDRLHNAYTSSLQLSQSFTKSRSTKECKTVLEHSLTMGLRSKERVCGCPGVPPPLISFGLRLENHHRSAVIREPVDIVATATR